MDFSTICRTCISSEFLNPIFTTRQDNETYSNAIYIATGIKVEYNDDLPQKMCTDCLSKLSDIFKFRLQCKDIETKLLSMIKDKLKQVKKEEDINVSNDNESNGTIRLKMEEYGTDLEEDKPLSLLQVSQSYNLKIIDLEKNQLIENMCSNYVNSIERKFDTSDSEISEDTTIRNPKQKSINGNCFNDDEKTIKFETKSNTSDYEEHRDTKNKRIIVKKSRLNKISKKCPKNEEIPSTELPYQFIMESVTEKIMKVKCKLCNKELSIRSIDSHMTRRHPGADQRKVKCDLCDSYIMKDKLNRHVAMMHPSGQFKCGKCNLEFNNKTELLEHGASCTVKKRKRKVNESARELHECDICHKVMQKASIRMHKLMKHAGMKPVCEHCGRSFGNKFRLREHYRAKHGYEKFRCSVCDFRSAGAMAMKNHERRHRGEKPFVCETCGAKFHAAYLLAQHKHSHNTEKLIKCDLCPSTFKANNSLHMHKLTCHSRKMYSCIICNKSYKCRHYVIKHIRHVHRYSGSSPPLAVLSNDDVPD